MLPLLLRSLLLLSIPVLYAAPAKSACEGRLVGDAVAGGTEYDPFDAIDFRHKQTISVLNTGSEACDFIVGFRRQPADGVLGSALHYRLDDNAGNALLSEHAPPYSARYIVLANVQPARMISTDYYLVLPRGQFTFAGPHYDNNVALLLHGRDHAGTIGAELDSKPLFVSQLVKAVVAVNVAGGGLRTTLNFDTLATGKERTVMLQTRSNYAYSLALSSANASQLKLDPEVPGQVWSIPYSLRVDNELVPLRSKATIMRAAPLSDGQQSHTLLFRIEDVLDRRAGIYRDLVTVDINVRP